MKLTNNESAFLWNVLNNHAFTYAETYGVIQSDLMNKLACEEAWLGSHISEAEALLNELWDVFSADLEKTDAWRRYKGQTEGVL